MQARISPTRASTERSLKGPFHKQVIALVLFSLSLAACVAIPDASRHDLNEAGFAALMQKVSEGWNANDAAYAASAFSEDALYIEPPAQQVYRGRDEIFAFFGGEAGRDDWMRMTWRNLSFNEQTQTGAGEFTFEWPGGAVHGITHIRVENGLIALWREYYYESNLEWEEFIRPSTM